MGSTPVYHSVLNVKAVVAAFTKEKALVGAFSVITNLRMELFEALEPRRSTVAHLRAPHGVKTLEFIGEFHQNEFSPQHKEDSRYSTFKEDLFGFNST